MAFEIHDKPFPGIAVGSIVAGAPVKWDSTGERTVKVCATSTDRVAGVTHLAAASGAGVAVHQPGEVVKVTAAATCLSGSTVTWSAASAGYYPGVNASGHAAAGNNVSGDANPGETFSLYIRTGGIN